MKCNNTAEIEFTGSKHNLGRKDFRKFRNLTIQKMQMERNMHEQNIYM